MHGPDCRYGHEVHDILCTSHLGSCLSGVPKQCTTCQRCSSPASHVLSFKHSHPQSTPPMVSISIRLFNLSELYQAKNPQQTTLAVASQPTAPLTLTNSYFQNTHLFALLSVKRKACVLWRTPAPEIRKQSTSAQRNATQICSML